MSIITAMRAELLANAGVSALVGTRIYPGSAPISASQPYIVYQKITDTPLYEFNAAAGVTSTLIQLTTYDTSYDNVAAVAAAVRAALSGWTRDTMGSGANTAAVRCVQLMNEFEGEEAPKDADEPGVHQVVMEYVFVHTEAIPTFS